MRNLLASSLIAVGTMTVNKAISEKGAVVILEKFGHKIPYTSSMVGKWIKIGLITVEIAGLWFYTLQLSDELRMTREDLEDEMALRYMEEYE